MTKFYGRSAAGYMIAAALGMRLFAGLAVDYPMALNAAWMCPLLGLVIVLPLLFAIRRTELAGNSSSWNNLGRYAPSAVQNVLAALFALLLMYDGAVTLRLLASSSNIIALGDDTVHLLIVPLGIVTGIAVVSGGDALGNSARIALRILPLFVLIVLLVQLPSYRFGWLTPVLGGGIQEIVRGGVYCAGCLALLSLPWLLALPDRNAKGLFGFIIFPVIGVSVLMLMQHMSAPAMPEVEFTRAARIELVLSNGRLSLYPQFVLNLLWYGGLLYLLCAEVVAAAMFIRSILPNLKMWLLAVLPALAVSVAAVFNPEWLRNSYAAVSCMFMILGGLFVLPMLFMLGSKRGEGG